jgi:hypothetical protein
MWDTNLVCGSLTRGSSPPRQPIDWDQAEIMTPNGPVALEKVQVLQYGEHVKHAPA